LLFVVDGPILASVVARNAHPSDTEAHVTARLQQDPAAAVPLTHVAYYVLLALATENRHGYAIIKDVAERTRGRVELEAGTLYAAIKRMKDEGWIEDAPTRAGADPRRRTYALSAFGRDVLLAESRRLEAMVQLAREARVLPRTRPAKA
jgi:DNA-binding PadR family transcriptional regulator